MNCCERKKRNPRTEESKRALLTRLNRIVGQLNGVKNMIEDDRYCNDVLIQLSAIDKAIRSLSTVILDEHLKTCIVDSVQHGDESAVEEIIELFRRFQ